VNNNYATKDTVASNDLASIKIKLIILISNFSYAIHYIIENE